MKLKYRVANWTASFVDLTCSIINILTLALYYPHWDMSYRAWYLKKFLAEKMKKSKGDK